MVANLPHPKSAFEDVRDQLEDIAVRAQELKQRLLHAIDEDTWSFQRLMEAGKETGPGKAEAVRRGIQRAIELGAAMSMREVFKAKRSGVDRFLSFIEKVGNALPHPATLFALFAALVVVALAAVWIRIAISLQDHYLALFRETLGEVSLQTHLDFPGLDLSSLEALIAALSSPDDDEVLAAICRPRMAPSPPRKSLTRPPASRIKQMPAATSQGLSPISQKPSRRPAAT